MTEKIYTCANIEGFIRCAAPSNEAHDQLNPFGTILWGFSYVLTKKGICRAGSDVGLIFIANNLRRIGKILTMNVLKEYLRMLVSSIPDIFDLYGVFIMSFGRLFLAKYKLAVENTQRLRWA